MRAKETGLIGHLKLDWSPRLWSVVRQQIVELDNVRDLSARLCSRVFRIFGSSVMRYQALDIFRV
jgi:hypothetical protein